MSLRPSLPLLDKGVRVSADPPLPPGIDPCVCEREREHARGIEIKRERERKREREIVRKRKSEREREVNRRGVGARRSTP